MTTVAILGAGSAGSAIAQALARRARVDRVRLVDADLSAASGKALDLQQSSPIDGSPVRLEATSDVLSASGASVVVIADSVRDGEWKGEAGLSAIAQLVRAGTEAPFVFAGADHSWLMEAAARELGVAPHRLIGTAPAALVGAVRALVGVEVNGSGADVQVTVVGRPPKLVVGWSSATIGGSSIGDRVPAHRLIAIAESMNRLWPPGPQAVAAATAPIVEALALGSRRLHQAVTILGQEFAERGRAALLPLELGRGRVIRSVNPSLSPRERLSTGLWKTDA